MTDSIERDALIEAMLPNVLFDGWSPRALAAAAERLGLSDARVAELLPGGSLQALEGLSEWADHQMVAALRACDLSGLRLHERIALALKERLRVLNPHREAVRRALAAKISPAGAVSSARAVAATVDLIWREAGDQSTDFSFHTKRATLAAIHSAAMLYWLDDESPDAVDTVDFIDRALDGVKRLPSLGEIARRLTRRATAPFDLLRTGVRP